jgi:DNA-binding GntR family transcriptional regulator
VSSSFSTPDWSSSADRQPYRTARVADSIRQAIGVGRYAPGDRLIEKHLAEEFETSRAPVREALRELEYEGLVELVPYRGAIVVGVSEEEVHSVLIPIRLTLERYAFTQALAHLGPDELAELDAIVAVMDSAAAAGDLGLVVEADVRFHELVLGRSGLAHTLQIWRSISPRIRTYFFRYDRDRDLHAVVAEHRELLAALAAGKEDDLLRLLEEHIAVMPLSER